MEIEMNTQTVTDDIKKRSMWSIVMGCVTAALGLFLIVYPFAAGAITAVVLGWAMIFVGIAQFIFALESQTAGAFFWKVALSLVYGIGGIVVVAAPLRGLAALTGIVGAVLLLQAVLLAVTAFQLRPADGWGWFLADAAGSLLLGGLILAGWPFSSLWAIGTLVGVSVFMSGVSKITIAAKIRSGVSKLDKLVHGVA
jgi:uncharacterized membrane protein HdeD (DUF308 family)